MEVIESMDCCDHQTEKTATTRGKGFVLFRWRFRSDYSFNTIIQYGKM